MSTTTAPPATPIPTRPGSPRCALAAWLVAFAGLLLVAWLSQRVERTSDELNYLLAGRVLIARQPLATVEQRFQGPLLLLGTQLTDDRQADVEDPATLRRARLGMLVFPAVLLAVLVAWSRAALGDRAALLVAALAAGNPTLLAYGPLLSSDVALTATALLAAWLAWRWLQVPSPARLSLLGTALGATTATKYTGLLLALAIGAVLLAAGLCGFDPRPERWRRRGGAAAAAGALLAAALVLAAVALATLYAAYLFAAPPFPRAAVESLTGAPLRALASAPGGTLLLSLLPEPMVLGIDYQSIWAGQTENGTFGDQRGNHWAYYPMSVLLKSPPVLLALAAGGAVALVAGRRSGGCGDRWFWALALLPPIGLLGYCSATRALQMGIRYVLPAVPALLLLAGAALRLLASTHQRTWIAFAVLMPLAVADLAPNWPNLIGYFNVLAGGSANGHRLCADGNLDWMQRYEPGQAALRARLPDLEILHGGEGPRFGRIAIYTQDLKRVDPWDHGRTYHWLARFQPIDRDFAAWLAYDVGAADFERARTAGDLRAAEDLAMAWLRRGDLDRARAALAGLDGGHGAAIAARTAPLIELVAAVAAGEEAQRRTAIERLVAAGQAELALDLARRRPRRDDALLTFWLLVHVGRHREAVEFLDAESADGSRTTEETIVLVKSLIDGYRGGPPDPRRAQRLLDGGPAPPPDSPWAPAWQTLAARVQDAIARAR